MDFDLFSDAVNEGSAATSDPLQDAFLKTITPASASNSVLSNQTGAVIAKIENIFESITDVLLDRSKEKKNQFTIQLKTRSRARKEDEDDEPGEENAESKRRSKKMEFRSVCFPSRNAKEAWKFGEFSACSEGRRRGNR